MHPLQAFMMAAMGGQKTTPPAPTYTPDVAQNIGQDKLAKHPYNPYGLLKMNSQQDDQPVNSKDTQFIQEMTKDTRE